MPSQLVLREHPLLPGNRWRRAKVHSGFLRCWTSCGLDRCILERLQALMDSGNVDRSAVTVYVTGHSLGTRGATPCCGNLPA